LLRFRDLIGLAGWSAVVKSIVDPDTDFFFVRLHDWAVDEGMPAAAYGVPVNKGKMGDVELVFDGTGVVHWPVVSKVGVGKTLVNVLKEGEWRQFLTRFAPPDPDEPVGFSCRIGLDTKLLWDWRALANRGYEATAACSIIPETVEGTFDAVIDNLAAA